MPANDDQTECLNFIQVKKYIAKPLDLRFKNIVCKVHCGKNKNKIILSATLGQFRSGRLTAILGPSGAGKTTFLDILAGHKTKGVTGDILVNGQQRNLEKFKWQACYIEQEAALLPALSTEETLTIAANLKMPSKMSRQQKQNVVRDIAESLNLQKALDTRVTRLSSGELKRLSIGVELVTNPPIMLFDEPTSGLDSVSSAQVISHLRTLARGGRNIICVIHQPSSRVFDMFDDLIVLANGRITYGGSVSEMISTFESAGFKCPQYYNRADYALEVASCEIEGDLESLVTKSLNRNQELWDNSTIKFEEVLNGKDYGLRQECGRPSAEDESLDVTISMENNNITKCKDAYAISQWEQFLILLKRSALCTFRDMQLTTMRVITHAIVGVVLGAVYYQIGNDAAKILSNSSFLFFLLLFIFFSNSMPTVLTFPLEASVFQRESLNNWYSLPAYYFSKILADIPLQIICPTIFVLVSYWMTGQPSEACRVAMVWLVCTLFTIISQGCGLITGVAFSPQIALFVLPALTIPMLMFSGFFIRFNELPNYMQPLSYISYFGYGFEAIAQAIYGYGRPKLDCSEMFCMFRDPNKFLDDLSVRVDYKNDIIILVAFLAILYCTLYLLLMVRIWMARR